MAAEPSNYIAAGCVVVDEEDFKSITGNWDTLLPRQWDWLGSAAPQLDGLVSGQCSRSYLAHDIQASLLKIPKLSPFAKLLRAAWITAEFSIVDHSLPVGVLRIYILPDDVGRGTVDRTNESLRKARLQILRGLNYSSDVWNGTQTSVDSSSPALFSPAETLHPDTTLLQLFNRIPPPQPDPDLVEDTFAQDAIVDMMDSRIPGLSTTLYPYQRRSAALMLQRETQPGTTPDPRLVHLKDQRGKGWYLDQVRGEIFAQTRSYSGISGGILAEEMGTGKTIICLALILATKAMPTPSPALLGVAGPPVRARIGSLADMAASCATRHSVPWASHLEVFATQDGYDYTRYGEILSRNPGFYMEPAPKPRRVTRYPNAIPPKKIYLTSGTLIVVPNNLFRQWMQEIAKHTQGLSVLTLVKNDTIPPVEAIVRYDIVLFAQSRFEKIGREEGGFDKCHLADIHFKRCIVDEGHRLGNSKMSLSKRSVLLVGLDSIRFGSRWVVTGTPSHGLYGANEVETCHQETAVSHNGLEQNDGGDADSSRSMERKDLERIGAMVILYLKARPWAKENPAYDISDSVADWNTYAMLPKHNSKGRARIEGLQSTLNPLIIRHPRSHVSDLLPPVHEKMVMLDGSFQDLLSLNLFSMMITFNAVQSQRTDMDYFFHPKQKKHVLQIVSNMKQSSFFGGSFFTQEEILKSVETAKQFLEDGEVPITDEDGSLIRSAITFGEIVAHNHLRNLSNQFHEMPLRVEGFPGHAGAAWSLAGGDSESMSTSASMLLALQRLIFKTAGAPEELNALLNGGLVQAGVGERDKILSETPSVSRSTNTSSTTTLAGNTKLGDDSVHKSRTHGVNGVKPAKQVAAATFSGPLELTKLTATVSAKLSYLIDSIVQHQEEDKMIIFYENENVAWYLSATFDVLQIEHLIYAKGLSTERRSQYVTTFHNSNTFRVLLMDLSQAAFGLDMRQASRVYFINPVLNPQVEAQAIGRVRRIHQDKPVFVETLVLKNSIDEVILERKQHMTQAEHRQAKSILDIRPIYNWIKNTRVSSLPACAEDDLSQMAPLKTPQNIFGKGFGRRSHPDEGLFSDASPKAQGKGSEAPMPEPSRNGPKRPRVQESLAQPASGSGADGVDAHDLAERPARRVKFAWSEAETD